MRTILLFFALVSLVYSSNARVIHGTVYDSTSKNPLQGVRVKAFGITKAVFTDVKGHYSIMITPKTDSISFSFVGYNAQHVKIKTTNTINVALQEVDARLNEVVVVGYSVQKQRSVLGSVSTIRGAEPASIAADNSVKSSGRKHRKSKPTSVQSEVYESAVQYRDPKNESYQPVAENGFTDPLSVPLSTFAVDVDAASYSNVRSYISRGQLPPADAVRIEEMINYFHYQMPEPAKADPVAIQTELSSAPWNAQHRLLRIGLKAKTVATSKLPPSNLVFLIDVSGSMDEENKLPLVKASMKLLTDQLRPQDKVAIVVYAGTAYVSLKSTSGDDKTKIKEAIGNLNAGGSTAGGAGITMAYEIARKEFIKGGNNRIILATDGDFNVGAYSDKDMLQLIEQERNDGISISILGFGMGNLKDSKMELMADKGHGNYAYIDNMNEATKCMVTEFGGTLYTVAKDVKLQIEFNPAKVQAYRLIGYEDRLLDKEDFNNDKKLGGDMGSGHNVTAFYEIIPTGIEDTLLGTVDPLKYQPTEKRVAQNSSAEMVTIKFRYKKTAGWHSKMEQAVVKDEPVSLAKTSDDFRFASSVAEFGMLLRNSALKQQSSYSALIKRAKKAKGEDKEGYRAEFIHLAESAKLLHKGSVAAVETEE